MMEATKTKKLRAEGKLSDREWEEAKERFASFGIKLSSKADEIGGTMDCTQVIACVALNPLNCSRSTYVCGGSLWQRLAHAPQICFAAAQIHGRGAALDVEELSEDDVLKGHQ